ncbi:hypothetical protein RJ641_035250 [Dillenia turbinata]|uniref:Lil3 protein n=1 Tax=Dillenia turbinata TaxID=194707 RepID=A0AAN8VIY0_9MAGN
MSIVLFSPPSSSTHLPSLSPYSSKPTHTLKPSLSLKPKKTFFSLSSIKSTSDNVATFVESEKKLEADESVAESNGSVPAAVEAVVETKFEDPRWVNGTWDLNQFQKDGKTNWDAVIDAEVRRRKWFEDNTESSSNDNPIVFDTSIIPWWAWMKRFHLPEAELLNGRAAMIGFFMAYLVDSLTGVGLVDQMGNFFCKTLLFVTVVGVLLIKKNENIETLKKLLEETTFYDKQWLATWQDEGPKSD